MSLGSIRIRSAPACRRLVNQVNIEEALFQRELYIVLSSIDLAAADDSLQFAHRAGTGSQ